MALDLIVPTQGADVAEKDALEATTTCAPAHRPDGAIYDGATYIGDGTHTTSGSGQTYAQQVASRGTATCHLRFYRDGNVSQSMRITGPAGNSKWTVKYLDYAISAAITASVTGRGWQTGSLARGA